MQANSTATGAPAADDTAGPTAVAAAAAKPLQLKQPAAIGSNWQALKQQLVAEQAAKPKRPRKGTGQAPGAAAGGSSSSSSSAGKKQIGSIGHNKDATPIVAMDCEMVGVGPGGERDSLARVSIVSNVLLALPCVCMFRLHAVPTDCLGMSEATGGACNIFYSDRGSCWKQHDDSYREVGTARTHYRTCRGNLLLNERLLSAALLACTLPSLTFLPILLVALCR
jgi:hypothetical protein